MRALTRSWSAKWGKSRPWILWTSVPFALSIVFIYTVPQDSSVLQFAYLFGTYNFCIIICYTAPSQCCPGGMKMQKARQNAMILSGFWSDCPFAAVFARCHAERALEDVLEVIGVVVADLSGNLGDCHVCVDQEVLSLADAAQDDVLHR